MSTSILFLRGVHFSPQRVRWIGDSRQPLHPQVAARTTLQLQSHSWDRSPKFQGSPPIV